MRLENEMVRSISAPMGARDAHVVVFACSAAREVNHRMDIANDGTVTRCDDHGTNGWREIGLCFGDMQGCCCGAISQTWANYLRRSRSRGIDIQKKVSLVFSLFQRFTKQAVADVLLDRE